MTTRRADSPGASFFETVRRLELDALRDGRGELLGGEASPRSESVRIKVAPSFGYPVDEIRVLPGADPDRRPREVEVTFMGFVGVAGVLPQHYTALAAARRHERDESLKDWLDVFQHRALSFFHRSWAKYRFPVSYERSRAGRAGSDPFTRALRSLAGRAGGASAGVGAELEAAATYASGHFARTVRSARALEALVADVFQVPVRIEEFVGQWLEVDAEDRTVLRSRPAADGVTVRLGGGAMLGERVWDVSSCVRLHVGPIDRGRLLQLRSGGPGRSLLDRLVADYLGPERDFDIVFRIASGAAPGIRLESRPTAEPVRLGRDAWLEVGARTRGERTTHHDDGQGEGGVG